MLLHVNAALRPEGISRSRRVGAAFLEAWREARPDGEVRTLDLATADLPMDRPEDPDLRLRLAEAMGQDPSAVDPALRRFLPHLQDLLAAEALLVVTPMWNFGTPWLLKRWIDVVVVPGVTFRYGAEGPEGLLAGKPAFVVGSSGGVASSDDDPRATGDFLRPYLRYLFGFVGIQDVSFVFAEGVDLAGGAHAEERVAEAAERARALAREAASALQA